MANGGITLPVARSILANRAPNWATTPLRPIPSTGTDNALFMLGDHHVLRLPKRREAVLPLARELTWLPQFSGLPLAIPELVFRGKARFDYDFEFGIFTWIHGQIASPGAIGDRPGAVQSLAQFLIALRRIETVGAPPAGPENNHRGIELSRLSDKAAASISTLADEIDANAARAVWERACRASPAQSPDWVHSDLKADNLIARDGTLAGVIDWGLSAVGDPAVDYAVAWSWVDPENRAQFRDRVEIDQDAWERAKGWALYCAVIALSYYRGRSHAALCAQSRFTLSRLGLLK